MYSTTFMAITNSKSIYLPQWTRQPFPTCTNRLSVKYYHNKLNKWSEIEPQGWEQESKLVISKQLKSNRKYI